MSDKRHVYEDGQAICGTCGHWFITTLEDGELDDDNKECDRCGGEMRPIRWEDIIEPGALLQIAENELESANHHSVVSMPSSLYSRLVLFVPKKHHLAVARAIADEFIRSI
jgi:hypothetical protein